MNAENADKNHFCSFFRKICAYQRLSASRKTKRQVARNDYRFKQNKSNNPKGVSCFGNSPCHPFEIETA